MEQNTDRFSQPIPNAYQSFTEDYLITPGQYSAKIIDFRWKFNQTPRRLFVSFMITEKSPEFNKRPSCTLALFDQNKSAEYARAKLNEMLKGIDAEDLDFLNDTTPAGVPTVSYDNLKRVLFKDVKIWISHYDYNNKIFNSVDFSQRTEAPRAPYAQRSAAPRRPQDARRGQVEEVEYIGAPQGPSPFSGAFPIDDDIPF